MEVVDECCCGLDVQAKTVVACLVTKGRKEIRPVATMSDELLQLGDWLSSAGCPHVAIESTGVYGKPVVNSLESLLTVILVNARPIKAVPGRKTDVRDCEGLADLLRHGLLRASFIPPLEIREVRELVRYRQTLVTEHTAVANRIQKLIESANIKLGQVASEVLGLSGRVMLRALAEGEPDVTQLAELAQGKLKSQKAELRRALEGRVTQVPRWVLAEFLTRVEALEAALTRVEPGWGKKSLPALTRSFPKPSSCARACRAWESGRPRRAWPKSVWRWGAFPPRNTGRVGPACVPALPSRRARARVGNRPQGTSPCGRSWWKRRGPPPAPRARFSRRSLSAEGNACPNRKPWARARTGCW